MCWRQAASRVRAVRAAWAVKPWLHWVAVYAHFMLYFLGSRLAALPSMLDMFASPATRTAGHKLAGIVVGMLEDFVVTTFLLLMLLALEQVPRLFGRRVRCGDSRAMCGVRAIGHILRFVLVLFLSVLVMASFAADLLLIRTRQMRFTMDFIVMYFRDKDEASGFQVDPREVRLAKETIVGTALVALGFTIFYVTCIDLLKCVCPTELEPSRATPLTPSNKSTPQSDGTDATFLALEEGSSQQSQDRGNLDMFPTLGAITGQTKKASSTACTRACRRRSLLLAVFFIAFTCFTLLVSRSVGSLTASLALNTSLNEAFRGILGVQFQPAASYVATSAKTYIESATEVYSLFAEDVLYRRTTRFKGPLAFDVKVEQKNLPNVLVLVVESFRALDSLYLSSEGSAGALMKKHNITLTPNFDRWAKRGVAFNNMWSSWQTSRSLESILFAQIPYDSPTETGTTTGRADVKLSGMPQLFKQKGYETTFTTGCTIKYDQWDKFLPSHGFDEVLGAPTFRKMAERDLGIKPSDCKAKKLDFEWGLHDDVSFEILGNIVTQKLKDQSSRVAKGKAKRPFFLNHYTISSHAPFEARPSWFEKEKLPDFSPLYEDHDHANVIKNYAELRYFQDLEMGKFLDRMEKSGALKDTIVVIVGDHGQSPESGLGTPYEDQVQTTHVAGTLIAEGRLGASVGKVITDATEQYDLLNTLMDIVGVPSNGFLQSGVGRSLKRQVVAGARAIWSNNPLKKKSVVRGDKRLVYDSISDSISLHDAKTDPTMQIDLFPTLTLTEQTQWQALRDAGRELNAYFKRRWRQKCISKVDC